MFCPTKKKNNQSISCFFPTKIAMTWGISSAPWPCLSWRPLPALLHASASARDSARHSSRTSANEQWKQNPPLYCLVYRDSSIGLLQSPVTLGSRIQYNNQPRGVLNTAQVSLNGRFGRKAVRCHILCASLCFHRLSKFVYLCLDSCIKIQHKSERDRWSYWWNAMWFLLLKTWEPILQTKRGVLQLASPTGDPQTVTVGIETIHIILSQSRLKTTAVSLSEFHFRHAVRTNTRKHVITGELRDPDRRFSLTLKVPELGVRIEIVL